MSEETKYEFSRTKFPHPLSTVRKMKGDTKIITVPRKDLMNEFFVRTELNLDYVTQLGCSILDGAEVYPPLICRKSDGSLVIVDGRNRLAAMDQVYGNLDYTLRCELIIADLSKGDMLTLGMSMNMGGQTNPTTNDIYKFINQCFDERVPRIVIINRLPIPKRTATKYVKYVEDERHKAQVRRAVAATKNPDYQSKSMEEIAKQFGITSEALQKGIKGPGEPKPRGWQDIRGRLKGIAEIVNSLDKTIAQNGRQVEEMFVYGEITLKDVRLFLTGIRRRKTQVGNHIQNWEDRLEAAIRQKELSSDDSVFAGVDHCTPLSIAAKSH